MPHPADVLTLTPCWTAHVLLEPTREQGPGPTGTRLIVPIVGGSFDGVLDPDGAARPFAGRILPGGFDLQRMRGDGVKELEAIYHMQTDDGVGIEIRNHALLTYSAPGQLDYARSRIHVEAPAGAYAWLNTRVFVGSVEVVRPGAEVRIRSFVLA